MNQRESKKVAQDETIKYSPNSADEYLENYLSTELDSIDRARYIEPLIAHFERSRSELSAEKFATPVFEQAMADLEEADQDSFTLADLINLIVLSALCITEMGDQPQMMYHDWCGTVFKFLHRERDVFNNSADVDKICSCIGVVEATFRPVPESMSIYGQIAKLIDRTKEAAARGYLLRLASIVCCTQDECEALAVLINDAIESPSEELIIHAIRAAAIFLDRFGDDSGLDSDVLEKEIPSAGQRECGVSKANIDRECRDVWEYVRSDDGEDHLPKNKLVEDIDHMVEGFAAQEVLRFCQRVFIGNVANNFQRTRNGVFRIAQRALGYNKQHRDRALGVSKSHEQMSRDRARKDKDKERSAARETREMELQSFE